MKCILVWSIVLCIVLQLAHDLLFENASGYIINTATILSGHLIAPLLIFLIVLIQLVQMAIRTECAANVCNSLTLTENCWCSYGKYKCQICSQYSFYILAGSIIFPIDELTPQN